MGKRILSLLLTLALILGMVPGMPFSVAAAQQVAVDYEAAYASSVTVDGSLSETAWLTSGKLSGGQPFSYARFSSYRSSPHHAGISSPSVTVSRVS